MQIVDALKNLIVAMQGSGTAADIPGDQTAEIIQYMADNWETINGGATDQAES